MFKWVVIRCSTYNKNTLLVLLCGVELEVASGFIGAIHGNDSCLRSRYISTAGLLHTACLLAAKGADHAAAVQWHKQSVDKWVGDGVQIWEKYSHFLYGSIQLVRGDSSVAQEVVVQIISYGDDEDGGNCHSCFCQCSAGLINHFGLTKSGILGPGVKSAYDQTIEQGHEDGGQAVSGDVGEDDKAEEVVLHYLSIEGVLIHTFAVLDGGLYIGSMGDDDGA